ncbi:MAG: S41 family peptidase [Chloroflexi bacterium]|nr:S41 family peptidase [Chloroflexota bacterium]MBP8055001.1 S41 family peptidase [Chloroflexota bacterium]
MSNRALNILAVMLVVAMASLAFIAGYFFNDYVEARPATNSHIAANDDEFAIFWEAWNWVEKSFIGELPTPREVAYGAIRGALTTLEDPYTVFIEPVVRQQEIDSLRGNFGGVGATISRLETGEVVLEPIPGNPAEEAGILSGDILLAVDGVAISAEMSVEDIANIVRGERGTEVILTVIHPETTESVDITIVRDDILIPSVAYRLLEEDQTIGYIWLTRFSGESNSEIEVAMQTLQAQGATRLILDLRGNGGGLLDAAVAIADQFLEDGIIMHQESALEGTKTYSATAGMVAGEMPVVVLIDGGTASASEILAGALQDRGRAILMGQQSFGKGSVQLVYDLSDGSSVHVTSARWFTPDRNEIDQHGLTPDVVVEPSAEALANNRDETLARAVEYLQNGE